MPQHSYFDRLLPGKHGSHTHNVGKELLDVAEIGGASYAFGYLQHKYGEKMSLWGVPGDLLAGAVLTVGAVVATAFDVGDGVTPIARNVGHAGLAAFFHTLGAGDGSKKSNEARLRIEAGDLPKAQKALAGAGVKTTVFGAIPKAPHGDFLSTRDLRAMASG